MEEVWKAVPGYEGYYEVSSFGNLRALERKIPDSNQHGEYWTVRKARPGPVYPKSDGSGYIETRLCKDGKVKCSFVHVLVWKAFKGDIPKGNHIDHMDNDPSNNRLDNLQCLTPLEHKKVTLERMHGVKILDEYWEIEGKLKNRGIAVHLSRAYAQGYAQCLKDMKEQI